MVYKCSYKTYKEFSEKTFRIDHTTKEAFKRILEYLRIKSHRKHFAQYTSFFYPAYSLQILDKFLRDEVKVPKEKLKIIGEKQELEAAHKFQFLDLALSIVINLIKTQSLCEKSDE